jgi:hypothetical protein
MYSQPNYNVDMALKRSFTVYHEWNLALEGDLSNIANHATYAAPSCAVAAGSTSTFCTVSGMAASYNPRSGQVSARISW